MRFTDKTIIVTGAGSGIGAATARLLAQEGANLILAGRREGALNSVRETLGNDAERCVLCPGDVQDEGVNAALVATAVERFGGLDAAFNNAGIVGPLAPVPDLSLKDWQEVQAINLTSGFLAAKYQIPAMKQRPGAAIVFTSSFVGHTIGLPGMGAYAASKAGLIGLAQVLAVECGTLGIRVNALLPGGTKTEMAGDDPEYHKVVAGLHALKRMATPEEIARTAAFLLSEDASFITGAAILCDGGNSISKF